MFRIKKGRSSLVVWLCGCCFVWSNCLCAVVVVQGFAYSSLWSTPTRFGMRHHQPLTVLAAAPKGALPDLVIPNVFPLGGSMDTMLTSATNITNDDIDDDRVWVPQTPCLDFRPLCFCVSQGYYVNLLRFRGGGILGRHYHASPVHALTLRGSWGYVEHDWHATPGTYVFEPPGETHTLVVDDDCDEMVALFHVTGALLYMDAETGETTGYDDVFTKLEKAREWYEKCGLGADYAEQFIR